MSLICCTSGTMLGCPWLSSKMSIILSHGQCSILRETYLLIISLALSRSASCRSSAISSFSSGFAGIIASTIEDNALSIRWFRSSVIVSGGGVYGVGSLTGRHVFSPTGHVTQIRFAKVWLGHPFHIKSLGFAFHKNSFSATFATPWAVDGTTHGSGGQARHAIN